VLTGQWLRSSAPEGKKFAGMLGAGVVLLAAGQIMDHWLPINKSIWTSTFSIFMAGLALVCLAFLYFLIDIARFSRWVKPFTIMGLNPIAIYVVSIILDTTLRGMNFAVSDGSNIRCNFYMLRVLCIPSSTSEIASLLYAFIILIAMFFLAWVLWRNRIFVKV
jgi:predicted acyltransferase